MKQKHTKYTEISTNKSMHSKMGPVKQDPIQTVTGSERVSSKPNVHV